MANRNNQPETAESTTGQLINITELKIIKKTPSSTFSGICAAYGWKPGKMVTEAEYDAAVRKFSGSPIGRKVK